MILKGGAVCRVAKLLTKDTRPRPQVQYYARRCHSPKGKSILEE